MAVLLALTTLMPACTGADEVFDDESDDDEGTEAGLAQVPEIVREVQPVVVAVLVEAPRGLGQGSGVIVREDGVIVTNEHVVREAEGIEVALADGTRLDAELIATDALTDLALLRVDVGRELPTATFADDVPDVGELAVAVGNPLGFENTVTAGVVSGLERDLPAGRQGSTALMGLLQTDAAISPGSSGGALVDAEGEVMGVSVAFIPPETGAVSVGFAIPSVVVEEVVDELLTSGEAQHGFLGVQVAPLTPQVAERLETEASSGAVVLDVVEGSPAEEAGIEAGDVVVEVDGNEVTDVGDFLQVVRRADPGAELMLVVQRDGEREQLSVTLSER